MTAYINTVQEEALSSYPLMLEARHVDISSLLTTFMGKVSSAPEHADDGVYQKEMLYEILNALNSDMAQENDLRSFRAHMEAVRSDEDSEDPLKTAVSGVQYTYDMDMNIYTRNPSGEIIISDLQALMQDLLGDYMQTGFSALMAAQNESASASQSVMMSSAALWREMLPAGDGNLINHLYEKQYNLVYGSWPSRYDEILLVVDEDGELPDLTLYALGLLPKESIEQVMRAALLHEAVEYEARSWSYETVCGLRFRVVMNSDCFIRDAETGLWSDLRQTDAGVQFLYDNGLELKVSGILRPSDDAIGARTSGGIFYTSLLTEYVVDHCNHSDIVQAQAASPDTDILSGLPFPDSAALTETEKAAALRARVAAMSEAEKAAAGQRGTGFVPPVNWREVLRQVFEFGDQVGAVCDLRQIPEDAADGVVAQTECFPKYFGFPYIGRVRHGYLLQLSLICLSVSRLFAAAPINSSCFCTSGALPDIPP